MNGTSEGLKPLTGIKFYGFNGQLWINDARMLAEAEVEHFTFLSQSFFNIGCDEVSLIINTVEKKQGRQKLADPELSLMLLLKRRRKQPWL